MRIVVTGAEGFIAKNLRVRLRELGHADVVGLGRDSDDAARRAALHSADFVFHLAGVNRPRSDETFAAGNVDLTRELCETLAASGRAVPVVYASSTQAALDNDYGRSKRDAEAVLVHHGKKTASPIFVFRLTNVFGKWCRADYNSVVATFCQRMANGLPVTVHDPAAPLRLIHVDDVVAAFTALLGAERPAAGFVAAGPVHETTVGALAATLQRFVESRASLLMPDVGTGFLRALYATFVSYLPPASFGYSLRRHEDSRGVFVEMLKTEHCGQFSFFTARPGVTRGGHYHHTKTEKFLVLRGTARYGFRHILTGERHERVVAGADTQVVETVPGWTHDITNVGDDELVVMLWANEIFDPARPDTVAMRVAP